MFGKAKRPWKKFAHIDRVELHNGDVKFQAFAADEVESDLTPRSKKTIGIFEDLSTAETSLDNWFKDWWPKQIKSTRRA